MKITDLDSLQDYCKEIKRIEKIADKIARLYGNYEDKDEFVQAEFTFDIERGVVVCVEYCCSSGCSCCSSESTVEIPAKWLFMDYDVVKKAIEEEKRKKQEEKDKWNQKVRREREKEREQSELEIYNRLQEKFKDKSIDSHHL